MPVANTGNNVLVDSAGGTLAQFTNATASNIKTQDGTVYTITSSAVGGSANGQLLLTKSSGSFLTLDSNHTFVCWNAQVLSNASWDLPVTNMGISLRGAKLVMTGGSGLAFAIAPIVGDKETQIVYRQFGTTWNCIHPGVNIDGSTLIFQGGGDGLLGRNPAAKVSNPNMIWTSTAPNDFVLGVSQAWGSDQKPSPMSGFGFQSIAGNNLVSAFTWNRADIDGGLFNNYFFVGQDWTYNVALPGQRPTALLRSYRRTDTLANASSYWGAQTLCPTILHIDLKTTLSATGVMDSPPTYLRTVNYNAVGVVATDKAVDVLALRFGPTVVDPIGNRLSNTSIVVTNTNENCSSANAIGNFRARLSASGITDSTGRIVITEPSTKDYTSNASHRTDSIVIRNRTLTTAWHKWWEAGTKLIAIADSRNGTGATDPENYAATDYTVSYRRAGSVFASNPLDMATPQTPTVTLSTDSNYNGTVITDGISVSYSSGVTTIALADGRYTLDQLWKAVIDYHAAAAQNESETELPFTAWTAGEMRFGSALSITGDPLAIVASGSNVKTLISAKIEAFNTAGNPTVTASYQDSTGLRATISGLDPSALGTTWVLGWISTGNWSQRDQTKPPAMWPGWSQSSGTGNTTRITLAASTEYQLFLRIPGYYAPIGPVATIDTSVQTQVTLSPIVDVDLANALLWPQTAAHAAQAARFAYDTTDQMVEYDNRTGATEYVAFLAAYRALETIAKSPTMAYQLIQPLYVNGVKDGFTVPRTNPLKARMSDASTGGAILQADIAYADTQAKAFDRFFANPQNVGGHLLIPQVVGGLSASTVSEIRDGLALEDTLNTLASGQSGASGRPSIEF